MIDIDVLRRNYLADSVIITNHASERLKQRNIKAKDIRFGVINGEIIEQYPNDFPYPSCLILGFTMDGRPLHVVVSDEGEGSRIITAYLPSLDKWESDFRTRRSFRL